MTKYKCNCKEFEIKGTVSIKVINGEVVTPQAYCEECKTYGKAKRDHQGFGGIIKRRGGKVGKL
jgi:hypothetical protein|tara:strand:- start:1472 stop:1663 length:192 start_codon:yes stop_codon:yes gene_type:complete